MCVVAVRPIVVFVSILAWDGHCDLEPQAGRQWSSSLTERPWEATWFV